jgi:hypothetical protein
MTFFYDPTLSQESNFLDLLEYHSPAIKDLRYGVNESDGFTFSEPRPIPVDAQGRNTEITVTIKPGQRYQGSVVVKYRRLRVDATKYAKPPFDQYRGGVYADFDFDKIRYEYPMDSNGNLIIAPETRLEPRFWWSSLYSVINSSVLGFHLLFARGKFEPIESHYHPHPSVVLRFEFDGQPADAVYGTHEFTNPAGQQVAIPNMLLSVTHNGTDLWDSLMTDRLRIFAAGRLNLAFLGMNDIDGQVEIGLTKYSLARAAVNTNLGGFNLAN